MSQPEPSNANTALLVMDVQPEIVSRFGDDARLEPLARAIAAARARPVPVIYVKVGFRPGYPEVSPANNSFAGLAGSGAFVGDRPGPPCRRPAGRRRRGDQEAGQRVRRKRSRDGPARGRDRHSGPERNRHQRCRAVDIAPGRRSRLQARGSSDCCVDADPEVHRVLLEKVFPRQARVSTWKRGRAGPR